MLLLDTNVMSELSKPRPDSQVRAWFDSTDPQNVYASAISDYEWERGTLLMERRDPSQGARLRSWLTNVRVFLGPRILAATPPIMRQCARLQIADPRALPDAILAATALHHGFVLVTRNVRDFEILGLTVLNPFDPVGNSVLPG